MVKGSHIKNNLFIFKILLGTRGPVWINGTYPQNIGETKELVACARFSKECCMRSWNVQVKKCPENQSFFFIYHLIEVAGCPMAYCAG